MRDFQSLFRTLFRLVSWCRSRARCRAAPPRCCSPCARRATTPPTPPPRPPPALVRLSTDYRYFERLRPTPEVRQLVPAAGFAGVPASGASDTLSSSAAHTAAGASSLPGSAHFSVLTYNILADMLSTCEQFPAVRVDVLDWSYRRELVLKELAFHAPDVLCLQVALAQP
ncbi:hypothetical protein T492DRAFT_76181 [Pavlovales sp. CCMP2436]|nr:hypothetical protein T492DRAFT_76181 [Pavlovales sp. CCMP2436]